MQQLRAGEAERRVEELQTINQQQEQSVQSMGVEVAGLELRQEVAQRTQQEAQQQQQQQHEVYWKTARESLLTLVTSLATGVADQLAAQQIELSRAQLQITASNEQVWCSEECSG